MVHIFFRRLAAQPNLSNQYSYSSKNYTPPFSQVFRQLLPANGVYGSHTASYLNVISNNFEFDRNAVPVHPKTYQLVTDLFHALGLNPNRSDNENVFNFWVYLTEMYWKIVGASELNSCYRDDYIFGFMSGFNLHNAKVIILASDPSRDHASSGYAFHKSRTPATRQLLENLNLEMWLMDKLTESEGGRTYMTLSQKELTDASNSCDLGCWIDQNVLLLNSWLSYEENDWTQFTDFLINYLSREKQDLVFILMGQVAFSKLPLIDYEKHLVLRVHHPSHLHRRTKVNPQAAHLEWDRVLPLINANFYLYQVALENGKGWDHGNMIDWNSVGGEYFKSGYQNRWNQYVELFDTAIDYMHEAVDEGSSTASFWDKTTGERALILKRCLSGKYMFTRDYNYEI